MLIKFTFNGFNKYRFHKPWISKVVNWGSSKDPDIRWGIYQGDEDGGDVEITAEQGDIVRWGQKGPSLRQTVSHWGVVQGDGSVAKCTMAQAHKAFKQNSELKSNGAPKAMEPVTVQLANFTNDQLLAELQRRGVQK